MGLNSYERINSILRVQFFSLGNGERVNQLLRIREKIRNLNLEQEAAVLYILERMFSHLPTLLMRNDKMGMKASIETRVPFLSNMLLADWNSMPIKFKINGSKNDNLKYILKSIAADYLPKEIIYRPKVGFAVPLNQYLKPDLKFLSMDFFWIILG
ncbi:MAG: hypothetical protein IPJ74_09140 [Saprospiraceae bacterium]|nr:hypothetical protein [Saprospiraceae bacterium]